MSFDLQHIRVLVQSSSSLLDDTAMRFSRHAGQIIVAAFIQSQHFRSAQLASLHFHLNFHTVKLKPIYFLSHLVALIYPSLVRYNTLTWVIIRLGLRFRALRMCLFFLTRLHSSEALDHQV